jgi:hypothetical protein
VLVKKNIRRILPATPLKWMRITRDDFVRRLKRGELYGNTEYYVSEVLDVKDANELSEMSREYIFTG